MAACLRGFRNGTCLSLIHIFWQLETTSGDIRVRTIRTPYDLLCQLESVRGSIAVDYEKYGWEELLAERLEEKNVQGCIGEGRQMLLVKTDKGNITVGKP